MDDYNIFGGHAYLGSPLGGLCTYQLTLHYSGLAYNMSWWHYLKPKTSYIVSAFIGLMPGFVLVYCSGIKIHPKKKKKKKTVCRGCEEGKSSCKPFSVSPSKRTTAILEIMHSDLAGPMQTKSIQGSFYTTTFIDNHSKHAVVYFIQSKDQFTVVTFPPHVTSASAIEKGKWLEWRDTPERTDSSGSNGLVEPDLDLDEEESFIVGHLVSADVIEHETDHAPDYGEYGVISSRLALS
jgi:hypothetical protein